MNREDWLRKRMSGIGGSDAPAALGMSQWKTPLALYMEKRGETPLLEIETEPMRWGKLVEPLIRQEYAERTGQVVRMPEDFVRNNRLPSFMFCNPDGITDSGRLVEIKKSRTREAWGEPGSDDIPPMYMIQVQHNLI